MNNPPKRIFIIFLFIVVGVLLAIRYNYHHIPFERDEGEYAYAGSLLLHHHLPYRDAYNMKFPGTYMMYALLMKIGGEKVEVVRLGVLFFIFITFIGICGISYLLTDDTGASMLAGAVFIALNNTMNGEGLMANAEHFVNLFMVWAVFFIIFYLKRRRSLFYLFLSGALFSAAVIMKQYGFAFTLFGFVLLAVNAIGKPLRNTLKTCCAFIVGLLFPAGLLLAWVFSNHLWQKFYFLTIQYAFAYINLTKGNFIQTWHQVFAHSLSLSILVIIGLVILSLSVFQKNARILIALFAFSFLALNPGHYYRIHYFILLYPALALIVAYTYSQVSKYNYATTTLAVSVALVMFFISNSNEQFSSSPNVEYQKHYQWALFGDMPAIARRIDSLIPASDKLSMFSEEPEIYFFSGHVAASGYVYTYPFFEKQPYATQMLNEYFSQVEANPSRLFVYHSGSIQNENEDTHQQFVNWWDSYQKNYFLTGVFYATSENTGVFLNKEQLEKNKAWQDGLRIEFWMKK